MSAKNQWVKSLLSIAYGLRFNSEDIPESTLDFPALRRDPGTANRATPVSATRTAGTDCYYILRKQHLSII